ncbi:hypothetical protein D3C72_2193680 [compost metagenome]
MDLLAVDGRDEGLVDQAVDVVRHAVGGALGVVDVAVVLFAQVHVRIVGDELLERTRRLHDALGMLVEHFKKIALSGQQLAEHGKNSWDAPITI